MNKNQEYVVLGTWFDKASKQPKSSIAEINSGTNKEGYAYQITTTDKTMTIDGTFKVGEIIKGTTTLNIELPKSKQFAPNPAPATTTATK